MVPAHALPNLKAMLLVCFSRIPVPGAVKTRLIPALGPRGAADLHAGMTRATLAAAREAGRRIGCPVEVHYTGGGGAAMLHMFGEGPVFVPQRPGVLGRRLQHAFADAFARGHEGMVLMGSDCPGITPEILTEAVTLLKSHDCVLGPAMDGGYYLIGLTGLVPELFSGMPWGDGEVMKETLSRLHARGMRPGMLPVLSDVDREEDLGTWDEVRREMITVVVAARNEQQNIGPCLERVLGGRRIQVVVADGDSTDATAEIARDMGACVLRCRPGRSWQMNRAARYACGNLLFFLHADTLPPEGYDELIRETLADEEVSLGAFRLRFDDPAPTLRAFERIGWWRCRWLQMPYGDQGLFLRREMFDQLGGFRGMPLMDDFDLVRRAGHQGRVRTLSAPALTSARRFRTLGPWRATIVNQLLVCSYLAGADPVLLAREYGDQGGVRSWLALLMGQLFRRRQAS